jgi:hypothetical protein
MAAFKHIEIVLVRPQFLKRVHSVHRRIVDPYTTYEFNLRFAQCPMSTWEGRILSMTIPKVK